jgi:hypothetical protein
LGVKKKSRKIEKLKFCQKSYLSKVETFLEDIVVKDISDIKPKSTTLHLNKRKDALKASQELARPHPL